MRGAIIVCPRPPTDVIDEKFSIYFDNQHANIENDALNFPYLLDSI